MSVEGVGKVPSQLAVNWFMKRYFRPLLSAARMYDARLVVPVTVNDAILTRRIADSCLVEI